MKIVSQREQYGYRFASPYTDELLGPGMDPNDIRYKRHVADLEGFLKAWRDKGQDSRDIYGRRSIGTGTHYNRERRAAQKQLLKDLYQKWSAGVPQNAQGMIMGGLGGAGKGTIQGDERAMLNARNYMKIDPDEIKKEMISRGMVPSMEEIKQHMARQGMNVSSMPDLSPMERAGLVHEEASDLAKDLAKHAMKERRNLLWDITMSSPGSVAGRISAMRKAGYGQVDGAFVDVDASTARDRVLKRHRSGQKDYESGFSDALGGRYVPEEISKTNEPTPGSGFRSRNAEVYHALVHNPDPNAPHFDNTVNFDYTGSVPKVTQVTGTRWHNHPLSQGGPTTLQNITGRIRRYFRMAAEQEQFSAEPTLRELLDLYEEGQLEFDALLEAAARVGHFTLHGGTHGETYQRAEEWPDDNAFFWVESAERHDVLNPDQVDAIADAIQTEK